MFVEVIRDVFWATIHRIEAMQGKLEHSDYVYAGGSKYVIWKGKIEFGYVKREGKNPDTFFLKKGLL